jgi:acyl-CoA thioesterase FadM
VNTPIAMAARAAADEGMPDGATEYVRSRSPFIVRRRVRWGECDPAGVVYTGHFTEYLISAVLLFMENLADEDAAQYRKKLGIETPCKGMSLAFSAALWPGDVFDMHVRIGEIRNSSYDLNVQATRPDGSAVFEGKFSPICIPRGERRAIPIPDELRQRLERSERA